MNSLASQTTHIRSGAYVLIIRIRRHHTTRVGALQSILFRSGYYAYVGSALQNLNYRILRHFVKKKRLHWHVDYLVANKYTTPMFAVFASSPKPVECGLSQKLSTVGVAIPGFGSSDCQQCLGHLYFISRTDEDILRRIIEIFRGLGLEPTVFPDVKDGYSRMLYSRTNFT